MILLTFKATLLRSNGDFTNGKLLAGNTIPREKKKNEAEEL